jgi:Endoplasmic reticulum vesicle transporter
MWGDIHVAKVAGRIEFVPGKTYEYQGKLVHDLQPLKNSKIDMSHDLASLSFGAKYPGQLNPLSGATFDQRKTSKENPDRLSGASHTCPNVLHECARPAA